MGIQVLYLAGWGRSGTTILETTLGSYFGVFPAGELFYLWRRGLVGGRICGCRRPVRECELWSRVLKAAYGDDPPPPSQVVALQYRVARVRQTSAALEPDPPAEIVEYRAMTERLYLGIAEVTGAQVIVDSSKRPFGAAILAGMPQVDPYLLHVVRDPRAVAYSWLRPKAQLDRPEPALMRQHTPLESTLSWLGWNYLTERVARRLAGHARRLRYEDFAARPRQTAQELLDWLGLPTNGGRADGGRADGGPFRDERTVTLGENHTVSGNPGRFHTGEVTISRDDAWRTHLPWRARLVAASLSLPLRARYGYLS